MPRYIPGKEPKSPPRSSVRPEIQAGIEAAAINHNHGRQAAHQFLARQNVHQPPPASRSRALATKEAGIGAKPKPPTAFERAQMAREDYRKNQQRVQASVAGAHPGAVAGFIGGIGQHPLGTLRDVTGIDVHRFYHPGRAIEQDRARAAALGRQGKVGSIGMVPGGGRIGGGIGRLFGREVAAESKVVGAGAVGKSAAGEIVRKSLPEARKLRAEQKRMYSAERSARVERAQAASEQAGGGLAGHYAGLSELKGPLPTTTFDKLRAGTLSQNDLEDVVRHVQNHPKLQFFDKVTATKALADAFEHGRTPAPHEIRLLHEVFGQEATSHLISLHSRLGAKAMDAFNIPRSLMASFDVSAPFRQALVAGAGHPKTFFKNFRHMFRALGSERAYQGILDEIHARPNAELYQKAGVKFTELRGPTSKLREEQFSSDLAEKIPGAGRVVRASGRAYTGFLDKMRADIFDDMFAAAHKKGVNVEDRKFLKSLAHYANSSTGRGSLGPVESWAPALNTVFFSPRLIASRVNFLDPTWYFRLHPTVRRQALKSILTLGSGAGVGLALAAKYVGAKVETDPRNSDFAKLRFDNTRVDILGGFQQYVRLVSQISSGKIISSTTGKTLTLGSGFGDLSRKDIIQRFAEAKFSPPVSFVNDFFKGTTFAGQPFSVKQALLQRIIPLVAQDAYDLQKSKGSIPLTAAGYGVSAFGIGMQTYAPKKKSHHGGGGGSRPNSLLGRSSGHGGTSLLRGGGSSGSSSLLRR
jgi:hypothetical protein